MSGASKPSRALLALLSVIGSTAQAAQGQGAFDVMEYRVLGNTVLEAPDIESVLYPHLGEGKSIDAVEQARLALEEHYHQKGYGTVFVDIPEQDINDGVVRLKVTEGKLARTRVLGARYSSGRIIRSALPEATEGTVPHLPALQAQLAALNSETPDRVATPVLKAGAEPGTVQLDLNVTDKLPFHGSVGVNNQYSAETSPLRSSVTLGYDDLFGRRDSLSLTYQFSPQDTRQVNVWAAGYTARLPEGSGRLTATFIKSDSDVATAGDAGSSINVLGKGKIYSLRWIGPASFSESSFDQLTAGIDYKDYSESILSSTNLLTPISYVNVSLGQTAERRYTERQFGFGTSVAFGLRGALNDPSEFAVKRYKGIPNYFLLRADGSYTERLTRGTALRLRAAGQYAPDSIIANEQYSIAGAMAVRGFLETEQLGDTAVRASAEFAAPRWTVFGDALSIDSFLFYDLGFMTRNNPLRAQDPLTLAYGNYLERPGATLRSAGIGLNLTLMSRLEGAFAWAYPLNDSGVTGGTKRGDSRVHFSLRASW